MFKLETKTLVQIARDKFPGIVFQLGDEIEMIQTPPAKPADEFLIWASDMKRGNYIIDFSGNSVFDAYSDFMEKYPDDVLAGFIFRTRLTETTTRHEILDLRKKELYNLFLEAYQQDYTRQFEKLVKSLETN